MDEAVSGFDSSCAMETHGHVVSAEVTDKIAEPMGPFTGAPSVGDSAHREDAPNFEASGRIILGSAWTPTAAPNLVISTQGVSGGNDRDVGAGRFANGLAQGGGDEGTSRFIMNVGYDF